jgi:hypothetical protein
MDFGTSNKKSRKVLMNITPCKTNKKDDYYKKLKTTHNGNSKDF